MPTLDFKDSRAKGPAAKKPLKLFVGIGVLVGALALGSTLAANINLNTGSNLEFGQGVVTTTACDSSILVTPLSTFVNEENGGSYKFTGVSLSMIDSNSDKCSGKDFIIKAFSGSGDLLDVFSNTGQNYSTLRVYDNAGFFYLVSAGSDMDVITSNDNPSANLSNTSFTVTFDTPLAVADRVKKITVESVEHFDTGIIYYGSSSYQLISNPMTWQDAYLDITTPVDGQCKYRRNGQCGYFAAITSDAERQAVISSVGYGQMWLGGSDIQEEGEWKWIDGPESGTLFSQGYTNWHPGEPNDSGNVEDALQTYSGPDSRWNDLPINSSYFKLYYLIEYSPDFRSRTNRPLPIYFSYNVGNIGPGGGKIFYYSSEGFNCGSTFSATGSPSGGKCNYLEAAPRTWYGGTDDPGISWATNVNSNRQTSVIGARETAIGSGYKNSLAIEAQIGNVAATTAAVAARAYRGGSKSDWYLPSIDELIELNINKVAADALNGYWSSTEGAADGAYDLGFNGGQPGLATPGKQQTTPVRPIRAF